MSSRDVVVVGGGLAGAIVADRLAEAGARCMVLETGVLPPAKLPAGWSEFGRRTKVATVVDDEVWRYRSSRPLEWMRVRAGGGRTLLWGGWSLRPDARSLAAAGERGRAWPVSFRHLDRLVQAAERRLDIVQADDGELVKRLRAHGYDARPKRAALAPGGRRPLCALDLLRRAGIELRGRSTVRRVVVDRGRTRGVEVLDAAGRARTIDADQVVLACSAVETARILDETAIAAGPIGTSLIDHLYCGFIAIANVPATRRPGPLDGAAFIPPGRTTDGALDFSIEARGPVSLATVDDEDLALLGIPRPAAERMSFHVVFAIGEMDPSVPRALELDRKRRDALGRPIPRFVLPRLSGDEAALARRMRASCAELAASFAGSAESVVQIRDPRDAVLGHEAATCPMGSRRSGAITDIDGAVHRARGLYVADAARMPTALDRHPSLALAGLALRTAERVIEDRRR